MSQRYRICHIDDIPLGEGREFALEGKVIAVFHTEDGLYAIDGLCPHAGGPIGTGSLNKSVVTCPWHGWQFDVKTGKHCLSENITTTTFDVSSQDGEVYVNIP